MSNPEMVSSGDPETILFVEDEVLIRVAIAAYLRECGYRVIEAVNADEAITLLRESAIKVDLVLCDVEMSGGMDGFSLASWIREHNKGVRIILASSPSKATAIAGDLCETGPMLTKPYDPQLLLDRIKRDLAKAADAPTAFPKE